MPRIVFEGPDGPEDHELPIGPNGQLRITVPEARHIQRVADVTAMEFRNRLFVTDDPDPMAIAALVQLLWKRRGKAVRFEDVDIDISTLLFTLLPEEEARAAEVEAAKSGGSGEDPTPDSSGSPTAEG